MREWKKTKILNSKCVFCTLVLLSYIKQGLVLISSVCTFYYLVIACLPWLCLFLHKTVLQNEFCFELQQVILQTLWCFTIIKKNNHTTVIKKKSGQSDVYRKSHSFTAYKGILQLKTFYYVRYTRNMWILIILTSNSCKQICYLHKETRIAHTIFVQYALLPEHSDQIVFVIQYQVAGCCIQAYKCFNLKFNHNLWKQGLSIVFKAHLFSLDFQLFTFCLNIKLTRKPFGYSKMVILECITDWSSFVKRVCLVDNPLHYGMAANL